MSEKPKIGFKRPPKNFQFKKGQSGNPAGRPKGSRNVRTVLLEALGERIKIKENGSAKTLSKLDVFIRQTVNTAIQGNDSGADRLVKLMARYTPPEVDGDLVADITAEDEALLQRFAEITQRKLAARRDRDGDDDAS